MRDTVSLFLDSELGVDIGGDLFILLQVSIFSEIWNVQPSFESDDTFDRIVLRFSNFCTCACYEAFILTLLQIITKIA